uniref:Uncharacterized protein n=1 Tax=Picea glauca TaxID=3330 RepID=A0A101LZU0_PICGL|nr:hypothetical protein ABT39_MTgene5401 [Picea glauca]
MILILIQSMIHLILLFILFLMMIVIQFLSL